MKLMDMLTESDNSTVDAVRVLALVAVIIGLALQIWVVVRWFGPAPQPFDFQNFGIGVGALFGGVGVALKLKPESQA
jgi:hypothetical protein